MQSLRRQQFHRQKVEQAMASPLLRTHKCTQSLGHATGRVRGVPRAGRGGQRRPTSSSSSGAKSGLSIGPDLLSIGCGCPSPRLIFLRPPHHHPPSYTPLRLCCLLLRPLPASPSATLPPSLASPSFAADFISGQRHGILCSVRRARPHLLRRGQGVPLRRVRRQGALMQPASGQVRCAGARSRNIRGCKGI